MLHVGRTNHAFWQTLLAATVVDLPGTEDLEERTLNGVIADQRGRSCLKAALGLGMLCLLPGSASAQAPEFFFSTVADTDTPVPDRSGTFQEFKPAANQ